MLLFVLVTLPFLVVFSRYERIGASAPKPAASVVRLYLGCVLTCGGLGYLALKGIGGSPHWSIDAVALVLPFLGCAVMGFGPVIRRRGKEFP